MARVDCNKSNFWCWSNKCKETKKCACNVCGELKTINPNIYDACVDACQELPRPTSADKYLCDTVGPEVLFNRYGIIKCGFDPYETLEGELYIQTEEKKEESNSFQQKLIVALGAVLLLLILVLVLDL